MAQSTAAQRKPNTAHFANVRNALYDAPRGKTTGILKLKSDLKQAIGSSKLLINYLRCRYGVKIFHRLKLSFFPNKNAGI